MKVLSIDGGGIRGLIPAVVLAEIERRSGRRIADLFDLIAGTSTGGILAAALACPDGDGRPRFTAEELTDLYVTEGPRIFDNSLLRTVGSAGGLADERYDSDGLVAALETYVGRTRLSEALVPVLLTAYDIEGRQAFFFRTERARADPEYDFALADAALATAAAPTYFEPVRVTDVAGAATYPLVDGGVFAANPAMCAWTDLIRAGVAPDVTVLASLGTGTAIRPIPYEQARGWGLLGWARPLIDVLFSGASETVDFQLGQILGDRYMRFQQRLEIASDDMDDASPENLRDLRAEGDLLVRENTEAIDDLCARLSE
ncbi:MAG TPA: patatin-like phospholipase family protein [Thermoleophilaceae bacterium]|nr:patatin-like phospholipase family protein [Thermoleophilaceae bacterium]